MSTSIPYVPLPPNEPERLPDLPPLVPPQPRLPEAPQVVAPLIYVQKKTQWEYQQLVRNLAKEEAPTADELDTLGQDGWELTGVMTDAPLAYFYFKRLAPTSAGK